MGKLGQVITVGALLAVAVGLFGLKTSIDHHSERVSALQEQVDDLENRTNQGLATLNLRTSNNEEDIKAAALDAQEAARAASSGAPGQVPRQIIVTEKCFIDDTIEELRRRSREMLVPIDDEQLRQWATDICATRNDPNSR